MEGPPQKSPNRIGALVGFSQGIPTSSDKVYRSVGNEDAIADLFTHGEVRNGANSQGHSSKRWGDDVYWSRGKEGEHHIIGGESHVIEAPHDVALERRITKDDVTAIWKQSPEGEVENKLEELRARLGIEKE